MLDIIYNDGERLIPGETHGIAEVVRHKSSYNFFKKIIVNDILDNPSILNQKIKILDIGCGTGHGTFMLNDILKAEITAMDISKESIEYAKQNYNAPNIKYVESDLNNFLNQAEEYDYIVSRHALEHINDGLNYVLNFKFKKRLIINVPFNEPEGNIHHLVNWITEKDFELYPNKEFFYEGLDGITNDIRSEKNPPNSIICISSSSDLKPIKKSFNYPVSAWNPEFLEGLGIQYNEILNKLRHSEEKNVDLENKLSNMTEEVKDLQNKLIISEEEKSIFLKLYRKFKYKTKN